MMNFIFESRRRYHLVLGLIVSTTLGCGNEALDQFSEASVEPAAIAIPSGSIIIGSNSNGAAGPGLISIWSPEGALDRVIYDYTKVTLGYASALAYVPPTSIFAVSDSGGSASNDFLDHFDYTTPLRSPFNLFSSLSSGAATTYMRQMALITDTANSRYLAFIAEAGNNRVARLSSPLSSAPNALNFTRDYNFANNGTCVLTTAYGVTYIPSTNQLAVVMSAATGRINILDLNGVCVGSTVMTNTPTGAAYHALGDRVLVTYAGNSSISAHSISTGAQSPAAPIYTSVAQLSAPRAIATDAAGNIYVGSDGLDQVVKLHWDGVSSVATYVGTIVPTSVFTQNISSITVVP